jgi:predicted nucleic acid-binding protein
MIVYFDTSALIKLYAIEPGSEKARELWDRAEPAAASVLLYPEVLATFARKRRELGDSSSISNLVDAFEADWPTLLQIPLDAEILAVVRAVLGRHPLRGADAVHLASALQVQRITEVEVHFACADQPLLDSAIAEGLLVEKTS